MENLMKFNSFKKCLSKVGGQWKEAFEYDTIFTCDTLLE